MKWCPNCQASHPTQSATCPKDGAFLLEVDPTSVVEEALPEINTTVGNGYELVAGPIRGSKSAVYKARHKLFDRTVVLKILLPNLRSLADYVERFNYEAKILSTISDPRVASIYDVGLLPGNAPFQVGEYCQGSSLDALLRRDEIETAEIISAVSQICDALDAVHKQNYVHLGLKPNHIMINFPAKNEVAAKLIDFYETERAGEHAQNTHDTPGLFRKCGFPSPELLQGKRIDARSDIYSLGCVLFKALTGHAPFSATDAKQLGLKHIEERPKPLHQVCTQKDFPAVLNNCVMTALEKEPERRFKNVLEMKRELQMIAPSLL
ncbi:MAG: serine/threonine protein kinase [Candidatus Melainabacteria bacterium]|nr:serine/threonine protein kinase [Candidatus Melainabacteria bacterium]